MTMSIILTIIAAAILWFLYTWIFTLLWSFTIGLFFIWPSRLVIKTIPPVDNEEFASEHPWRIHLAAFLFKAGNVVSVVTLWVLVLWLLTALGERWATTIGWLWLYALSFLIFLSELNNARGLNSQYNSLSYRLRGGTSELRYRHGQREASPDELLGPIPVKKRGF